MKTLRTWVLATLLASCGGPALASAAEIAAQEISTPFYDEAGRLTHRITARRGVWRGEQQKLEDVEVLYYDASKGPVPQRLRAREAIFDQKRNTLTGEGAVTVETGTSRLSGEGFDFALASSQLNIHRAFRLEHPDVVLTSDRAIITLAVEKAGAQVKLRDVQRCEARDNLHLVFSAAGRKKSQCDEAFSDLAIYDGVAQTVELPHRVRALRDGVESQVGRVNFDLKK